MPDNVEIGEGSWLHSSYSFLHYRSERPVGVKVGRKSGIYIDTFFELGPDGEVEVGDHCTLAGPVFSTNGRVVVGDYVLISQDVVVADSFDSIPPEADGRSAPSSLITIGDDAWIGARAVLLPGARVGDGAIVGAAAVVDFEVPNYAVVAGNPARVVSWSRPETRERRGGS